jgi:hypothetical protein
MESGGLRQRHSRLWKMGQSMMQQSTAPIEVEPFGSPKCEVCGVTMRLYGVEPHPTLNRTDLRTYVCPHCENVQTTSVSNALGLVPLWKPGIDPEQIEKMHLAYEKACAALGLSVLPDKINEVLVTKIVEISRTENCSADLLCERVLAHFHESRRFADESKA